MTPALPEGDGRRGEDLQKLMDQPSLESAHLQIQVRLPNNAEGEKLLLKAVL